MPKRYLCRAERLPQFPDAPTFKELGYEGLDNEIMWRGFAIKKGAPEEKEPQELPDMYYRLLENVGRYFGENISLRRSANGKGSMTIRFDSDEQMEQFLQALDPNRG